MDELTKMYVVAEYAQFTRYCTLSLEHKDGEFLVGEQYKGYFKIELIPENTAPIIYFKKDREIQSLNEGVFTFKPKKNQKKVTFTLIFLQLKSEGKYRMYPLLNGSAQIDGFFEIEGVDCRQFYDNDLRWKTLIRALHPSMLTLKDLPYKEYQTFQF